MVMHSAHNKRKQETIVKSLLENWGTSKKITLSLHSLHSLHGLHSLQSAVCMVCVSTLPVSLHDDQNCKSLNKRAEKQLQIKTYICNK